MVVYGGDYKQQRLDITYNRTLTVSHLCIRDMMRPRCHLILCERFSAFWFLTWFIRRTWIGLIAQTKLRSRELCVSVCFHLTNDAILLFALSNDEWENKRRKEKTFHFTNVVLPPSFNSLGIHLVNLSHHWHIHDYRDAQLADANIMNVRNIVKINKATSTAQFTHNHYFPAPLVCTRPQRIHVDFFIISIRCIHVRSVHLPTQIQRKTEEQNKKQFLLLQILCLQSYDIVVFAKLFFFWIFFVRSIYCVHNTAQHWQSRGMFENVVRNGTKQIRNDN